jgi:hypothetical protein
MAGSKFVRVLGLLVVLIVSALPRSADAEGKPSLRADLNQFGYIGGNGPAEYSTLGFLSDDLLLVVINQRVFHGVDPIKAPDEPPSLLAVFDLNKKQILRKVSMPITKTRDSVVPLTSGRFLILSNTEVRLCSADLRCERSFPTNGAFDELSSNALKVLGITDQGAPRDEHASADATRVITSELSYTGWNKIVNILDIDQSRPENLWRIAVTEARSGKVLLSLHWNPKTHLVSPALSPSGTRLAVVRKGALEVYDVP